MESNVLIDLGLAKTCSHFTVTQERSGEAYKEYCTNPVAEFGGFCSKHDPAAELVRRAKLDSKAAVMEQKRKLEDVILPKATQRIEAILEDVDEETGLPRAKDADVIKIWQTTMDRVGLAAVQGIVVEGEIKVEAPLDILRRMLTAAPVSLEEITDAEVVSEITDGS